MMLYWCLGGGHLEIKVKMPGLRCFALLLFWQIRGDIFLTAFIFNFCSAHIIDHLDYFVTVKELAQSMKTRGELKNFVVEIGIRSIVHNMTENSSKIIMQNSSTLWMCFISVPFCSWAISQLNMNNKLAAQFNVRRLTWQYSMNAAGFISRETWGIAPSYYLEYPLIFRYFIIKNSKARTDLSCSRK